jgi:hypothetical protein
VVTYRGNLQSNLTVLGEKYAGKEEHRSPVCNRLILLLHGSSMPFVRLLPLGFSFLPIQLTSHHNHNHRLALPGQNFYLLSFFIKPATRREDGTQKLQEGTVYTICMKTLVMFSSFSHSLSHLSNKTKQNKTKQNKTKQNKTKQNKTKQNKTTQHNSKTHAKIIIIGLSYSLQTGRFGIGFCSVYHISDLPSIIRS